MSLGWLAIGVTGDITLTGLNVDNGTLFVDKDNNRVGIRTTSPSSVLQIDSATDTVYSQNPLTSSGVTMFSNINTIPSVSGVSNFSSTLWINSTTSYIPNSGASIGLGGRTNDTGSGSQHMTFSRISGVQNPLDTSLRGDFVVETADNGIMFEKLRVKTDGKVGLGVSDPQAGIHLLSDMIVNGITNNGFRKDTPYLFTGAGTTTRIPTDTYLTTVRPTDFTRGWLAKIDGNTGVGNEYVNSIAINSNNGDVYVVGTFDDVINFYNDVEAISATRFPPVGSTMRNRGFVAKFNTSGNIGWAARFDSTVEVEGLSIALLPVNGTPNNPYVVVSGTFLNGGVLTAYNAGSSGAAFATTLSNAGGGKTGFLIRYGGGSGSTPNLVAGVPTSNAFVHLLSKVDGNGNIIPSCLQSFGSDSLYVAGYYNASAAITAFNNNGSSGASFSGPSQGTDVFLCKYNKDLNAQWITVIRGSAGELLDYPSNGISIDSSENVYLCGSYQSSTVTFFNVGGSSGGTLTLGSGSTRSGFITQYSSAGVFSWASKIISGVSCEAVSLVHSGGNVYVTGNYTTNVSFLQVGNSGSTVTTQTTANNKQSVFLAKYAETGTNLWSTKIQSPESGAEIANSVDKDVLGNIYVGFSSLSGTVVTFQRDDPGKPTTTIGNHSIVGEEGMFAVSVYNADGKVLYKAKVDSNSEDRLTCMKVYKLPAASSFPRIVLGGWTKGKEVYAYDASGTSFRFMRNLDNDGTVSSSNSAMVIQMPASQTYLMDPPLSNGITKKIINKSNTPVYIIPYYDADNNVETAFTEDIIPVPGLSAVELTFDEQWTLIKDTLNNILVYNSSTGRIGIGTTNPGRFFQVQGEASFLGNVGIGVTAAGFSIHVEEFGRLDSFASYIRQTNSNSGGLFISCIQSTTTNPRTSTNQSALRVVTGGTTVSNQITSLDINGIGNVLLGTRPTLDPTIFVDSINGRVGINKTPVSTLDVQGTFSVSSNSTMDGNLFVNGETNGSSFTGMVSFFAMDFPPPGWLAATGQNVNRTTYARLFERLGTMYGAGNGTTTFTLPDLRGNFVRGHTTLAARDPSDNLLTMGPSAARPFGSQQNHAMARLTGYTSWYQTDYNFRGGGNDGVFSTLRQTRTGRTDGGGGNDTCGRNYFDNNVQTNTSIETRPRNIALLGCIKY